MIARTVAELAAALAELPQDAEVFIHEYPGPDEVLGDDRPASPELDKDGRVRL